MVMLLKCGRHLQLPGHNDDGDSAKENNDLDE